jgi:hypothetical protein
MFGRFLFFGGVVGVGSNGRLVVTELPPFTKQPVSIEKQLYIKPRKFHKEWNCTKKHKK